MSTKGIISIKSDIFDFILRQNQYLISNCYYHEPFSEYVLGTVDEDSSSFSNDFYIKDEKGKEVLIHEHTSQNSQVIHRYYLYTGFKPEIEKLSAYIQAFHNHNVEEVNLFYNLVVRPNDTEQNRA